MFLLTQPRSSGTSFDDLNVPPGDTWLVPRCCRLAYRRLATAMSPWLAGETLWCARDREKRGNANKTHDLSHSLEPPGTPRTLKNALPFLLGARNLQQRSLVGSGEYGCLLAITCVVRGGSATMTRSTGTSPRTKSAYCIQAMLVQLQMVGLLRVTVRKSRYRL